MTRTRTVEDLDTAVDGYRRDGYTLVDRTADAATLRTRDHGSLIAHIALFFTLGWLTLGLLNGLYALYRRRKTSDTVRLEAA